MWAAVYLCGRSKHHDGAPPSVLCPFTSTMMLSRGPRVVGRAGTYRTPFASSLPVPRSWVSTSSNSIVRFDRFTTFTWLARAREEGATRGICYRMVFDVFRSVWGTILNSGSDQEPTFSVLPDYRCWERLMNANSAQ